MFYKKDALENFAKLTGKHLARDSFFNKVAGLRKFREIFKSTFFTEHLQAIASDFLKQKERARMDICQVNKTHHA